MIETITLKKLSPCDIGDTHMPSDCLDWEVLHTFGDDIEDCFRCR